MTSSSPAPIRDLRRASEIVQVLVRHGYGYLLRRDRLGEAAPPVEAVAAAPQAPATAEAAAARIKRLLEDLGPTFIKLGQIISTRPDVVPEPVAQALATLQDAAQPLDLASVEAVIHAELGRPAAEVFVLFDPAPIATASIAQVHRARLQTDEGERDVVVKVQRPGIQERMHADLSLLRWLAWVLEGTIEEVSAYSPSTILEHFEAVLREELDFRHELGNLERARENFAARPDLLVVPEPFRAASSGRVLVMERLDGRKITVAAREPGCDREALVRKVLDTTYKQVFEDGFFHGDPHPGNILVLGDGRIGMIDYGVWGRLSEAQQDVLIELLVSIAFKSPPTMTRLALRVGQPPPSFDRAAFEAEVGNLMDRYVGVRLADVSAGGLIADAVDVIRRHRIRIPPEFAVLSRATATLEGVLRSIDPGFDFQAVALPYVKRLLLRRLDVERLGPEAVALLLGLRAFVTEVPTQIDQLLRDLSTGRFQVSVRPDSLASLETAQRVQGVRQVCAVLAATSFVCAAVTSLDPAPLTAYGAPVVPVVCVALGLLALWWLSLTFLLPHGLRRLHLGALLGRRR
ncbi:MAG: AarF/ABC1/UbiB kinase family protein [Planctomycetota bacterium]|nr:AarF/ABC1/UbiB kinase family protein [Planctomycetota bacterium]